MAADTDPSKPSHLEPSELGTKEYWDRLYTTELTNNTTNPTDRGTVWFDDSDAEAKLLDFLDAQTTETCSPSLSPLHQATTSFLDLGCGNGSLLFSLRQEGWEGRCLGVDYSEKSVALAKQIAQSEQGRAVEFAVWDVFNSVYEAVLGGEQIQGWDVVLDKGTFDAISLSEDKDSEGRRLCEGYKARIVKLVKKGGIFLVTSCNWTEQELEGWFGEGSACIEGAEFVKVGKVHYPSFEFGGIKGQTISTLCFLRI